MKSSIHKAVENKSIVMYTYYRIYTVFGFSAIIKCISVNFQVATTSKMNTMNMYVVTLWDFDLHRYDTLRMHLSAHATLIYATHF